nr:integrase, catalytic region, zinc finger, CCHC-type, peptidase aspartic, catalytic [Tanacetum cinerariifolium]
KLQPKADIRIFIGYAPIKKAFWIYNRRTRRIVETIHVDFDELTTMASEQSSSGPVLYEMTPATISSELIPKPTSSTSYVPPVDHLAPEVIALIANVIPPEQAESTSSPSSITVDQDAPSPSKSQTIPETQPPVLPQDVEDDNHDIEVAHMRNDPLFGMPILEVTSDQSLLTKYGLKSCDPVDTPIVEKSKLDEDTKGKVVDPSHYRGMIGTLLYLTASIRLGQPKNHLHAVQMIENNAKTATFGYDLKTFTRFSRSR